MLFLRPFCPILGAQKKDFAFLEDAMREKLLVVGAADMNLTLPVRAMPPAGASVTEDGKPRYSAGGGGATAAVALASLGASPILVARLGNDVHGKRLLRLYNEVGIDTRYITSDGRAPTGLSVALSEAGGESRAVYYPGANRELSASAIDAAFSSGAPAGVCLPMDLARDILLSASRLASNYSLPVFTDAAGMEPDFPLGSLARAEVFCPDDRETYAITGTFPVGSDSCLKAAVELEKRVKARYYVIRLAERGLFLYDGRYCHMIPAFGVRLPDGLPLARSLTAVLALAYLRNKGDIQAACRYALGYNALLISRANDPSYTPTDEEITAFIAKY